VYSGDLLGVTEARSSYAIALRIPQHAEILGQHRIGLSIDKRVAVVVGEKKPSKERLAVDLQPVVY
jgi:hypothetical protein